MKKFISILFLLYSLSGISQSSSGNALVGTSTATSAPSMANSTLSSLDYPFTVAFWMKLNGSASGSTSPIFSSCINSTGYSGIRIAYNSSNEISVSTGNNNGFTSFGRRTLTATANGVFNKWTHIAVIMTGPTTGEIYLNGRQLPVNTGGTGPNNFHHPATGTAAIGTMITQMNTWFFDGQLDEISVWSRALPLAEIRQNMCQKLSGNEPALEAYYRLDGTGTTVADASGNGQDMSYVSGNGFSRTISAVPLGDTSVYLYALGTVTLTSPSGVSLTVSNNTGSVDGTHAYFVNSHPDQDQGINALCDTIGHFGRFIATNPAQPNISGRIFINPPMSTIFTRTPSNLGTWSTAPVTQTLFYSDVYREFLFDPGQFPDLDIGPFPSCDSSTITAPFIVNASYLWSTGATSRTIQNPGVGTHWLTLTTNCQSVTDTFEVYRDTITVTTMLDTAYLCAGTSTQISVYPFANRPPIDSVYWTDGVSGIQRAVSQPGWYYSYTAVSGSCWQYDSIWVESTSAAGYSIANDTVLCSGESVNLSAPTGAQNIQWSTGSSASSITVSQGGAYWITFDLQGCSIADTIDVEVVSVSASLPDTVSFCSGTSTMLTVSGTDIDSAYWSTGESGMSITVSSGGTYWVRAYNSSCYDAQSVYVEELDGVQNIPDQTALLCVDESVVLSLVGVVNPAYLNDLQWSTGDTTKSIEVFFEGAYTVSGMSPCGAYTVTYLVNQEYCEAYVYFPNAFSPNGDRVNDFFEFKMEGVKEFRIQIFDRWGNVIYETAAPNEFWDGSDTPLGVYGYKLVGTTYRDEVFTRSGTVMLLK